MEPCHPQPWKRAVTNEMDEVHISQERVTESGRCDAVTACTPCSDQGRAGSCSLLPLDVCDRPPAPRIIPSLPTTTATTTTKQDGCCSAAASTLPVPSKQACSVFLAVVAWTCGLSICLAEHANPKVWSREGVGGPTPPLDTEVKRTCSFGSLSHHQLS